MPIGTERQLTGIKRPPSSSYQNTDEPAKCGVSHLLVSAKGERQGPPPMLDVVRSVARQATLAASLDVEILSLATANPPCRLPETEAAASAKQLYPHVKKLWGLYDNTGIDFRYCCEPIDWYLSPHSWEDRTKSFHRHALDLLEQVTVKATDSAGIALNAIDMIVTSTTTGLA